MKKLTLHQEWLGNLLPEGLSYPTSTLISGPGGSGKPLIGFAFVNDWLQAGGEVIFITLQYPEREFVKTSLKELYDVNVNEYQRKIAYIQFDYSLNTWNRSNGNIIRANLLKPGIWEEAVNDAENSFAETGEPGTLVFASALNLLLFSPTYKQYCVEYLEDLIQDDKNRTYILSVSTSAFKDEIKRWEKAADNLMFARMEPPMKLYLSIDKMEKKSVAPQEVAVPIPKKLLEKIKDVAESARKRDIPNLRKI